MGLLAALDIQQPHIARTTMSKTQMTPTAHCTNAPIPQTLVVSFLLEGCLLGCGEVVGPCRSSSGSIGYSHTPIVGRMQASSCEGLHDLRTDRRHNHELATPLHHVRGHPAAAALHKGFLWGPHMQLHLICLRTAMPQPPPLVGHPVKQRLRAREAH